jgi:diguanylate cyclase
VLIVSSVLIAVVGAVMHDLLYWRLPIRRARKVLTELSKGDAPLEDLQGLRRGVRCLMPSILDLAHRERSLRAQIARLEMEVQQRVVNRTESLERKLGLLQLQASRDALTGLFNRRAFEIDLPRIIQSCRQSQRDLQLLMIDVDHFKTLNDTLGHMAGDDLLRSIGQVMRSTLRDGDAAFRYGGDEFVVLLPGGNESAANALADRLRSLVDGLTKHHHQLARRPQLSIGISSLVEQSMTPSAEKLIEAADRRLYAIKHSRPKSEQRVA